MADLKTLRNDVAAMGEDLFTVVNIPFKETSELQRQLLTAFCFGMLFAIGQIRKLTPSEVHALAICFIQDVFKYSAPQAKSFADLLIESASGRGDTTLAAVIHRGIDGHRQWSARELAELKSNLEEIFATIGA